MNGSVKRLKSSKFNKVDNNNFKNAKKLRINKFLKERRLLTEENFSPIKTRKGRTKSNKNLTNNLLFKKNLEINLENKETQNITITNKTMKRFLSNCKINTIKFKDMILSKKSVPINEKEEENEGKQDLSKYFNPEPINKGYKRHISSNNINYLFKSVINNNNNNNIDKKINNFRRTNLFEKEFFNDKKKIFRNQKVKKKIKIKKI